jgi:hypothetical protein
MALTRVTQPLINGSELYASNYCTGTSAGESAAFQAFIDELSTSRKRGILDINVYLENDVFFNSNTTLIGTGQNFGGSLVPKNAAQIYFAGNLVPAGVVQHCLIQDMTIYGDQSTAQNVITVRDGYSLRFKNVRIHHLNGATNANKTGILVQGDADQRFDNLVIRGDTVKPSYGVRVTGGSVTFNQPDVEQVATTYSLEGGDTSITDIYLEQFSVYGVFKAAAASLNLKGGKIIHSGGAGTPVRLVGDNYYLDGVKYFDSTGGSNPYMVSIYNPGTVSADFTRNGVLSGIPASLIQQDANNYGFYTPIATSLDTAGEIVRQSFSRKLSCASGVATPFFNVFFTAAYSGPMRAIFTVYAQSGGNGLSVRRYVSVLANGGSSNTNSTLTLVDDSSTNIGGNWNIALSATLTVSTATSTFNATITTSGGLNSGQPEIVYATLELEGQVGAFRVTNA